MVELLEIIGLFATLGVGGIISDHILTHLKFFDQLVERLPSYSEIDND